MDYAAIALRTLTMITKFGGDVTFIADPSDVTGKAVQVADDPETIAALDLVARNPVTLKVAAQSLALVPAAGMLFDWGGTRYVAKSVEAIRPDGATAIVYTVIGAA